MGPGSQLGWAEIYGSSPSWDLWVQTPHLESVGPHLQTEMAQARIYGSSSPSWAGMEPTVPTSNWDLWVQTPHLESVGPHLRTGMGSMGLHFPTERDGLRSVPCARLQIGTWESPPPSWDLRAPIPKPGSLGLHRPVGLDGDHGALICSQLRAPQAEDGRRKPWFRRGDSSCWEQPAVAQQQQQHSSTAALPGPFPTAAPSPPPPPALQLPEGRFVDGPGHADTRPALQATALQH